MKKILIAVGSVLGFALFVGWCAGGSSRPSSSSAESRLTLSDSERAEAFQRTIIGVGDACPGVTRTFHQGTQRPSGTEFWNVACSNGKDYAITLEMSGATKVLSCEMLAAVAKVKCFEKFD